MGLLNLSLIIFLLSVCLLFYIFIGYPIMIIIISKVLKTPHKKETYFPNVTLLIPAFNEEEVIQQKIENTLSLNYPSDKLEIIVCDDASIDNTNAIVKSFESKGVILSDIKVRSGKVGGINRALSIATGEIFVISDADIILEADSLNELIYNFYDEKVGCVVAQTKMITRNSGESKSGGFYWKYEALIRESESQLHSTVAATGHLMGIRKKILQKIPDSIILDDFYLCTLTMQQGYRVISEPKAIAWERPTTSMKDESNRRKRLTAGRYQILFMWKTFLSKLSGLQKIQVISHKFLRLAIPFFMIIAFISNLYISIYTVIVKQISFNQSFENIMLFFLIAQILFYTIAVVGWGLSKAGYGRSKITKWLTIPYYLCATNFSSVLGLFWYLSNKHSVLWQKADRQ